MELTNFNEAVIEGEIVPDGIPPARSSTAEIRVVDLNPLVDLREDHSTLLGTEDGFRN